MIEAELLDEYIERFSNWGRWGPDDQAGTANLITRDCVRTAARAVTRGQVVPLGLTLGDGGPQTGAHGRFNCMCFTVASGTDHELGRQQWDGAPFPMAMGFADDTVVMHLQSATHWDSLCHIFHRGRMYNGYPASMSTASGSARNGLEQLTGRLVGRGVLLDLPASQGVDWLQDGDAITPEDLDAAAEFGRVTIQAGDIVLIRTGQLARCRVQGWGTYAGGDAPGLSFLTVPWLSEHQVGAVASDTWGVEVRPNEIAGAFQPFHLPALVYMGIPLGEMFDFEALARACAEDGRYEMLLSASPLPFVGTAGGPPGPVAIR
ncbi:MAG TPA: cyclase family protein [Solirubrobacteraceae bacterium]|nr:cyclase family protein [Solirubrobacteraceae bacterium]